MNTSLPKRPQASFSWNIVTKGFHGHGQVQEKVRSALSKLERHLEHFPSDAVHLQVVLERHPRKPEFTAGLVLRVPSNILRSAQEGPDPVSALSSAVKTLLRQLASLKSELRREVLWKRKSRRAELHASKPLRFAAAPLGNGTGPQNLGDVVSALMEQNYTRLLRYVRRHQWHEARLNRVPHSAVDARAVVDEVARQALAAPNRKPAEMGFLIWFYMLARRELARRYKALRMQAQETVPLEETRVLPEDADVAAGYEPEQPLDILEEVLEPPVVETKDLVADPSAAPPDEVIERRELLEQVQNTANSWPKPEREVFELYFVEGFEPVEIAMVLGVSVKEAEGLLAGIRGRVRDALLEQSGV
ncbi:MAG TPA: sigma-70 family RNA polymerase sigma factor [Verrucomicrobiae bacterium]